MIRIRVPDGSRLFFFWCSELTLTMSLEDRPGDISGLVLGSFSEAWGRHIAEVSCQASIKQSAIHTPKMVTVRT